jgi:transcriptional regulator with XRE-family HTH domain
MVGMTVFERVKKLCDGRKISINDLEKSLGYSKNTLYRLKTQQPGADKIQLIADYFNVSTDYLLGRTDEPNSMSNNVPGWATTKDKRDFKKMLEEDEDIMFDGVPISGEDKEKIKRVLEALFWDAKEKNKKTYGRKKTTDE